MNFVITGGSRGIAAGVVLDLVAAGHDVAFTYRSQADKANAVVEEALRKAPEQKCRCYRLDVRDSAAVDEVGDRILEDFSTVDAVVCSAAVNRVAMAMTMSDEDWHDVLDTNLSGAFYVCRYFLPTFLAAGRGRFVLISSMAANGMSGHSAYAAAKSGLVGLSGTLAKEYGRKGVTSNVLILGYFETDMTREGMSPENRQFWINFSTVGRIGKTSDVSSIVLYLASEGAGFINGQVVHVTGGLDWTP